MKVVHTSTRLDFDIPDGCTYQQRMDIRYQDDNGFFMIPGVACVTIIPDTLFVHLTDRNESPTSEEIEQIKSYTTELFLDRWRLNVL